MAEVILTRGLPASGKSTWARAQVDADPGQYKRVNKDDLRAMLDNGHWSKRNETMILALRDEVIRRSLARNCHVIVDDTNLSLRHERHIRQLVAGINQEHRTEHRVWIKDFTDVALETCIERDSRRPNPVGEKVIRGMYRQLLKPPAEPAPAHDPSLPDAVLCNLDGTLVHLKSRDASNTSVRDLESLNIPVANALEGFGRALSDSRVILLSGRPDTYREDTIRFLDEHEIRFDTLLMRRVDDGREDALVKREFYEQQIKGNYNVRAVFDHRLEACRMWNALGLPLFRVGDPDAGG